jgi:hypothetical protein
MSGEYSQNAGPNSRRMLYFILGMNEKKLEGECGEYILGNAYTPWYLP